MAKKKIFYGLGGCVVVVAAIMLGLTWRANTTSRSDGVDNTVALANAKVTDVALIKRGAYVMRAADCAACHTAKSGDFAGGYSIDTPFGAIVSSNITPDRDTGIGNMTERDFFNAVRQGQGQHGFLYPAMPYTNYVKMSRQDMDALWAYFTTVKPVSNEVHELAGLRFPYNQRLAMAGWNLLFFDNKGFAEDPSKSVEWNRGHYLVDGAGHCEACHTPRNSLGGPIADRTLQGGSLGKWYAPNITNNPHVGLGHRSVEAVAAYLKNGADGQSVAAGPMAEAIENSTQYLDDADLKAIAAYLKSLPGNASTAATGNSADDQQMSRGKLQYEAQCSACHGPGGEGVPNMITTFAGNHALQGDDATELINVVLGGARAAHTQTFVTGAGMPAFDWKLTDSQIAAILTYVRNSWGNSAPAVTAQEVQNARQSSKFSMPIGRN
ncbi:cytochrome c [Paraburkholderia sp. Ac-20347]|uniref:c-type cytochrome n=1 Tax=Paraburkholderia sp. Ac-20347 TaxID=2703892 RepID=UPI00197E7FD2|nr:cytochrome c [Paraburkholderia sp. Ac-20347]MBN3812518.1 cytochrome c [Paraburkholderia sp. Ac-20347]